MEEKLWLNETFKHVFCCLSLVFCPEGSGTSGPPEVLIRTSPFIHVDLIIPPLTVHDCWSLPVCMKCLDKEIILHTGSKHCTCRQCAKPFIMCPDGCFSNRRGWGRTCYMHESFWIKWKGNWNNNFPFRWHTPQCTRRPSFKDRQYKITLAFSFKLAFGHRSHYRNMQT